MRHPVSDLLVGKRWPCISVNAAALVMELQATSMVSADTFATTLAAGELLPAPTAQVLHLLQFTSSMRTPWREYLMSACCSIACCNATQYEAQY